jgi:hypothetical protein
MIVVIISFAVTCVVVLGIFAVAAIVKKRIDE